jgi:uncharacterized membrane protein
MTLMIAGILLWALAHMMPSLSPALKQKAITSMGANAYKITFALTVVGALVLIVLGWRSAVPMPVYVAPESLKLLAIALMVLAFLLFGASMYPTRIKRVVRHPQLSGLIVWAVAHLLLNGDSRSVLLFGGLGVWAILEIILLNRRDGDWIKIDPPAWFREIRGAIISLVILTVVIYAHPYIAGVPVSY